MPFKLSQKKNLFFLIVFPIVSATLVLCYRSFYVRIGAFGCADQCFNFVAAYFMGKGRNLYSEIFFNHQPLMAWFSYVVQKVSHPDTIYSLVLYHRLAIWAFSVGMDLVLIFFFSWAGLIFVVLFELTRFYFYGSMFIPEAVSAYLLVFILGLWWQKTVLKKENRLGYFFAPVACWGAVFMTLPYVPLALAIFFCYLFPLRRKLSSFSLILFLFISGVTLASLPLKNYFDQLMAINLTQISGEMASSGTNNIGIIKIFAYPLLLVFSEKRSYLWQILLLLDIAFLSMLVRLGFSSKGRLPALTLIIFLGLAAVRYVKPGTMHHEAFHMLVWQGLFLAGTSFLFCNFINNGKSLKSKIALSSLLIMSAVMAIFHPLSFLREKVDTQNEFTIGYAPYESIGSVIKSIALSGNTLFLDEWDDLIYWKSGLDSSYSYALYTPVMTNSEKFQAKREKMFLESPPDFYYSYGLPNNRCPNLLPQKLEKDYAQFYFSGKEACLYIKRDKISAISQEKLLEIEKMGYSINIDMK